MIGNDEQTNRAEHLPSYAASVELPSYTKATGTQFNYKKYYADVIKAVEKSKTGKKLIEKLNKKLKIVCKEESSLAQLVNNASREEVRQKYITKFCDKFNEKHPNFFIDFHTQEIDAHDMRCFGAMLGCLLCAPITARLLADKHEDYREKYEKVIERLHDPQSRSSKDIKKVVEAVANQVIEQYHTKLTSTRNISNASGSLGLQGENTPLPGGR